MCQAENDKKRLRANGATKRRHQLQSNLKAPLPLQVNSPPNNNERVTPPTPP